MNKELLILTTFFIYIIALVLFRYIYKFIKDRCIKNKKSHFFPILLDFFKIFVLVPTLFFPISFLILLLCDPLSALFFSTHLIPFYLLTATICFLKRRHHDIFSYFQNQNLKKIILFKNAFFVFSAIFFFVPPFFFKDLYSAFWGQGFVEIFWGLFCLFTKSESSLKREKEKMLLTFLYFFYPMYVGFIVGGEKLIEVFYFLQFTQILFSLFYVFSFFCFLKFFEKRDFKHL